MPSTRPNLPVVRSLPADFSIEDAFEKFAARPGCLWLDSASRGPSDSHGSPLGRYSFLTSDPIAKLVAYPGQQNPWPILQDWSGRLPEAFDPSLPPFQGGIAGMIGYEAATWLEPVGMAGPNDLPTPLMSLGLYDWTIAVDHLRDQAWMIVQGWDRELSSNSADRTTLAEKRIGEVEAILNSDSPLHPNRADQADIAERNDLYGTPHCDVFSNFTGEEFRARVADIVRRIRDGDSFQVNLAQRLLRRADTSSLNLYQRLRATNPAPFGAYYNGGDFQVLSSSPEGFLKVRDRHVETRPIKGTVRRTGHGDIDLKLAQKLAASEKDRAENVMIVDLMRNDLSRVCTDDSVRVTQLCEIERYEYVQHLVSVVEGELSSGNNPVDLLQACFPGGSVTGAPKIEAMRTIAELEKNPRGPYCGSIGYIGCGQQADFNILIRTITATSGYWQIPVGGGITAKSAPEVEEYETWSKAEGMLKAIRSLNTVVQRHR